MPDPVANETPVPLRSHSRHRRRHYRRRPFFGSAETRRRSVLSTGEPPLLHSRALERWPRITVRECRKRPARHSMRAARYKRCSEPAPLFPDAAANYLPFCDDDAGDNRYRSALRCPCRRRAAMENLLRDYPRMNFCNSCTCNVTRRRTERTVLLKYL